MEWSIQQIARIAGTTSRTLRHNDDIGLVPPSRIATNGYRYYDVAALVRLQRVLLLRELGLGLAQIAAVEHSLTTLRGEDEPVAEKMFDGFDHTQYREEVEQRWGADAYARSDAWWRGMSGDQRQDWKAASDQLAQVWQALAATGADPRGDAAQELAARHVGWLRAIPGTPAADPQGDLAGYVRGLAEMYVADERFAANYGGMEGATFVRDALLHHVPA